MVLPVLLMSVSRDIMTALWVPKSVSLVLMTVARIIKSGPLNVPE